MLQEQAELLSKPPLKSRPRLSIVIPCFNESETIRESSERVLGYLAKNFSALTYELILIDDGSTDPTARVLADLAKQLTQIRPIYFPVNRGRGEAIKTGIRESAGEFLILLDADLSYDVDHIGAILRSFDEKRTCDAVVVSPYMRGGTVRGVPWSRLLVSRLANWILAGFFSSGLSTVTCVVRGYRGDMVRMLPLFEEGKELHLEILRKLTLIGAEIQEIPGNLAWKESKKRGKRQNNIKLVASARRHLLYALLMKPTRIFQYTALLLVAIGLYETTNTFFLFLNNYSSEPAFWHGVWSGLAKTFSHSPHSIVIASVSLILGIQCMGYVGLLQVLKLQQEETLRHLLAVLETRPLVLPKE